MESFSQLQLADRDLEQIPGLVQNVEQFKNSLCSSCGEFELNILVSTIEAFLDEKLKVSEVLDQLRHIAGSENFSKFLAIFRQCGISKEFMVNNGAHIVELSTMDISKNNQTAQTSVTGRSHRVMPPRNNSVHNKDFINYEQFMDISDEEDDDHPMPTVKASKSKSSTSKKNGTSNQNNNNNNNNTNKEHDEDKEFTKTGRAERKPQARWTSEESSLLKSLVEQIGADNPRMINWKEVSRNFKNKTGPQCAQHWKRVISPTIEHSPWSPEQERKLLGLVATHGTRWNFISAAIDGRTDVQCRYHYCRVVKLDKKPWNAKEIAMLKSLVVRQPIDWVEVSTMMAKRRFFRTPRQCEDAWTVYSSLQKEQPSQELLEQEKGSAPVVM